MKYHMIVHTDVRNFPCELCKDRFKTQKTLHNHMKTVHAEKDTAICQVCGKVFKHHSYLKQHVEIHSERDKKCPLCPAVFSTIKMLRRHMTSHSDEKHKCSLCDKEFSYKGDMNKHKRRVHTENRPHMCSTCGKGFKGRGDLREHMLSHAPPKYRWSPVCFKMFVKPWARKVHMKQHIQRGELEESGIPNLNSVNP